jgi:hypothetical protein
MAKNILKEIWYNVQILPILASETMTWLTAICNKRLTKFKDKTRSMVFSILAGVSLAGMLVVFGIRPLERSGEELVTSEAESKWQKAKRTAKIAFFSATKMIQQKD